MKSETIGIGTKLTVIIVLKLIFIVWIKLTYFSEPINTASPEKIPAKHLFNLSNTTTE